MKNYKWNSLDRHRNDFAEMQNVRNFNPTVQDYADIYAQLARDCPGCKVHNTSGNMIREVVRVGKTVFIR